MSSKSPFNTRIPSTGRMSWYIWFISMGILNDFMGSFFCPVAGGWCLGLHIRSQSPGEAVSCRSQTGLSHWTGPVCLSTGESDISVFVAFKTNCTSKWSYWNTPSVFTSISLSFQFPELHAMIMRRFSYKGDVDRAWQYVLQVWPIILHKQNSDSPVLKS